MQKIINNRSIVFVLPMFCYCFKLWNILSIEKISKDTYVSFPKYVMLLSWHKTTIQLTPLPLSSSQVFWSNVCLWFSLKRFYNCTKYACVHKIIHQYTIAMVFKIYINNDSKLYIFSSASFTQDLDNLIHLYHVHLV